MIAVKRLCGSSVTRAESGEEYSDLPVIIIPVEFPSLNEIIAAAKSHYGAYSKMKHKFTDIVIAYANGKKKYNKPVNIYIDWYSKNKKKDPDNIAAGKKFILDGMVKAEIIPNDTFAYIRGFRDRFFVDDKNPRVEVYIEEN